MSIHDRVIGQVWRSAGLIKDLDALCALGGRLWSSDGERRAREQLRTRLAQIPGVRLSEHKFVYDGWARVHASLAILGEDMRSRACHSLLWSPDTPPGGLEAEFVDVGRGTEADFEAAQPRLKGRIALVRHEYPFAAGTVHRMKKYMWAREMGAAGFIIANCLPGEMVVTGFAPDNSSKDIPAVGTSLETGAILARLPAGARLRIEVAGRRWKEESANLIAEVPGRGPEWVVLSAHYDGHDLGQSALDNGTGAAAVPTILEAFAPHVPEMPRGLRAMLFTAEEWGLYGSRVYVNELPEEERRRIAVNVNLDTIAGSPRLACLTSGFEELETLARSVEKQLGIGLDIVRDLRRNSDHYNFARHGIPALRLVCGFDAVDSAVKYLLMPADTRDKVHEGEFKFGAAVAAEFVWHALVRNGTVARHKTAEETKRLLQGLE